MEIFNLKQQRLYLTELIKILGWDKRTIKTWCYVNGIFIYSDGPNGRKYMSRIQFLCAWNKEFIEEYQEKYGDRWLEALEAHINVNVFMALKLSPLRIFRQKAFPAYTPTLKESEIMSRLTGIHLSNDDSK